MPRKVRAAMLDESWRRRNQGYRRVACHGPGVKALSPAALQRARPARAVVHAEGAFAPQFDRFEPEVVAAPVRRTRRRGAVPRGFDRDALQQRRARIERLALQARPCADAAVDRAHGEIRIAFAGRAAHDAAFDPHLAAQRVPVQHAGHARIRREFVALAAVVVGEERRHNPGRRPPSCTGRRAPQACRPAWRTRAPSSPGSAAPSARALRDTRPRRSASDRRAGSRAAFRNGTSSASSSERGNGIMPQVPAISCGTSRRTGKRIRPPRPCTHEVPRRTPRPSRRHRP